MRFLRPKITILDKTWTPILQDVRVLSVPNKDELIYLKKFKKYFSVVNVIHQFSESQQPSVFVVIEELTKQPEKV